MCRSPDNEKGSNEEVINKEAIFVKGQAQTAYFHLYNITTLIFTTEH